MKNKILAAAVALALVGFISATPALAENTGTMNHKGGMMGMKQECMETNKDGKTCDKQMMEKCQMKMTKGDCKKMMNPAKAEDKQIKK